MFALLLALSPALAQEVQGFAEVRGHAYVGVDGEVFELIERVRPEFTAPLGERVSLSATVEAAMHQGRTTQSELQRTLEASDLGPFLDLAGCTWPAEDNALLGVSSASDYLSVERLYLDVYLPWADFRVGRQAAQWGSAFMVNPTDPFPEVLLTEPWRPRRGTNAVRTTLPIGDVHEFNALVGADDTFSNARVAGRLTLNALQTDFSLVGAYRQEASDGIVGLDIRGTLGVGFWLEGAIHLRETPYEELAVGIDYSLPVLDMMMVSAQYYRNGNGSADPDPTTRSGGLASAIEAPDCGDMGELFPSDAAVDPDPFAPFFSGRDYAMLSLSVAFNRDLSTTALWVQNLGDGTGLIVPIVAVTPNGWLEISATGQIPLSVWGDGGELHPSDDDLTLEVPLGTDPLRVDLSGLMPDATVILSTKISF